MKGQLREWLNRLRGGKPKSAPIAYDLWAKAYDIEAGNLMIALDGVIFPELLMNVVLLDRVVLDVGCGTGRHWPLLSSLRPKQLCGYDVSAGMLEQLKLKYPEATVYHTDGRCLNRTENETVDVIACTLVLAYFPSLQPVFDEWNRVLKTGGDIVLTSYHPQALQSGGTITFSHHGKSISIEHKVYTLDTVKREAEKRGWQLLHYQERIIDEQVRHYYEEQNALHLFNHFKGIPIIYGMHFRKN